VVLVRGDPNATVTMRQIGPVHEGKYADDDLTQVCHPHYKESKKHAPASLSAGERHYKQVN